ncbi:DNA-binding protein [Scytonema sp. UIC 10036]|uniref:DNA-binding protein n=1 Tax=Scytonema sp. UIC 10036 TaxID=2304196 RepID=UPI0012DAC9E7|nr:DNA-binding protein [Scytonema sp. UIC 10036]MUG95962.1 DNA-binding protein [Scytonema sp. UIC 10036]
MKFDWSTYLDIAQNLLDEVNNSLDQSSTLINTEAKIRCSISRAYYSVFCLARNYLRDVEGDVSLINWKAYNINVHQYVIEEFKKSKNKDQQFIGTCLERMRLDRNQADYDDSVDARILLPKAKKALNSAKKVVDLLNKLS